MLGNLFQQFYSLADTIIVGRFVGVNALASVGSTSSINYMIIGFVTGVCNGFAIPIAQYFGAPGLFGYASVHCKLRPGCASSPRAVSHGGHGAGSPVRFCS